MYGACRAVISLALVFSPTMRKVCPNAGTPSSEAALAGRGASAPRIRAAQSAKTTTGIRRAIRRVRNIQTPWSATGRPVFPTRPDSRLNTETRSADRRPAVGRGGARSRSGGLGGGCGADLGGVASRERQEDDEHEDAAEEDVAGARGAQTQAAVLLAVLRHPVAD